MCLSAPKTHPVPTIPERKAPQLPDGGATAAQVDQTARRRRGLYASIMTSPQGTMGAPSTSSTSVLG